MSTTIREITGTQATILSTELNSLANNGYVVSSVINSNGVYNNTAGSGSSSTTGDGYISAYIEVSLASSTVGSNAAIYLWFIKSLDGGTTYEDAATTVSRSPDCVIPLEAVTTTAQKVTVKCALPACKMKFYAQNNNNGNALASSGNNIYLLPATYQSS